MVALSKPTEIVLLLDDLETIVQGAVMRHTGIDDASYGYPIVNAMIVMPEHPDRNKNVFNLRMLNSKQLARDIVDAIRHYKEGKQRKAAKWSA